MIDREDCKFELSLRLDICAIGVLNIPSWNIKIILKILLPFLILH